MTAWTPVELAPGLWLFVAAEGGLLRRAAFSSSPFAPPPGFAAGQRRDHEPVLRRARHELDEYARGRRREFQVPFRLDGTQFQQDVWKALLGIPWGERRTYGEIARALGRPGAARAVGAAAGRNPLPVIVPCHRLVAADGTLGGFSGGLEVKRRLLALEGLNIRR
ncbi:MAG: methylated-DNA--[protein]-cysteine S-methyltransferase [Bryobacteraceae bacterium]|nr:methylated-DNA--[protein]-cysteine S-methyltransferase [Bryobacteraceae bacterium]